MTHMNADSHEGHRDLLDCETRARSEVDAFSALRDEQRDRLAADRADRRYAESLMERQWREGLHEHEATWLARWQATHENPERDDYQVGRRRRDDLGVRMGGLDVIGVRNLEELGYGNVNIAGGWYWRVGSVQDERGWQRGWWSELHGLDAFLEAIGVNAVPGASEPLGVYYDERHPWYDRVRAYEELAIRLLATLVIVSREALKGDAAAAERADRQADEFSVRSQFSIDADDVTATTDRPSGQAADGSATTGEPASKFARLVADLERQRGDHGSA